MAKQKESPLKVVPLNLMSDQPVLPTSIPIGGGPYRPSPIHYFVTNMVDFNPINSDWHADFVVTDIKNKIWLEINPYDDTPIDFDCNIDITISVKHRSFPDGTETIETHTLSVDYKHTAHEKFNQIDLLELSGGQQVVVTITGINVNGLSTAQAQLLSNKVLLKAQTTDTRFYRKSAFSPVDCSTISFTNNNPPEVEFTWAPLEFAEEYDIEIIYDDYYGQTNTQPNTNDLQPFGGTYPLDEKDFYQNATRITTKTNNLTMSLINEHVKYRFRIRPVGRQGKDWEHRYEHSWYCDDYIQYEIPPHEDDKLNYQSIITYAEEGKHKIVNEYFDGRMASRQKVTALQSQMRGHEYALVQESIYDEIGRKAIEVLPAPVMEGAIQFYEGFSVNNAGDPYSHEDFTAGLSCPPSPGPMGTQSGASHYYSSAFYNSLSGADQNSELALIPDAYQYPFSQTVFMNDNTNRPIAQGGVGKDHRIGSGHETMISYVDPTQSELDRLFGTEVGKAKYYKKVVTEDPNGQVSYAYQDLKGNTIATSLYGKVANLDSLESYRPVLMTDDIALGVKGDEENYQLIIQHAFYVEENNKTYTFDYDMIAAEFRDLTCTASSICYDCVYDAEIAIINTDCNDTLYHSLDTLGQLTLDQSCQGFDWASALAGLTTSTKGNHIVKAILTVNEEVADLYVNDYFNDPTNQCVEHLTDFEDRYLAQIPDIPCEYDCEDIAQEINQLKNRLKKANDILSAGLPINSSSEQVNRYEEIQTTIYEIEASIAALEELCDSRPNKCEQARRRMLMDLSPHGQYATLNNTSSVAADQLSIFHPNTYLQEEDGGLTAFYQGSQFSYPYQSLDGSIIDLDPTDYSIQEFVTTYWQEEWAEQFLSYHPEYFYYLQCNYESANFDRDFLAVTTASDAINLGFIGANGMMNNPLLLNVDPQFMTDGLLSDVAQDVNANMLNFYHDLPASYNAQSQSIYEIAIASVCQGLNAQYNLGLISNPAPSNCLTTYGIDHPDPAIADQVWLAYRGLYISIKQRFEHVTMTQNNIQSCLNICIGRDTSEYNLPSLVFGSQPCNRNYAILFANKQKVFLSANDIPGLEDVEDLYNYDLLDENLGHIFDAIESGLTDSLPCSLIGTYPPPYSSGSESTSEGCVTYDCLAELPSFFNQLIPATGVGGDAIWKSDQLVDLPMCFGASPFIQYEYKDGQNISYSNWNSKHTYQAILESAAADLNACTVLFSFYELDDANLDPSLIDDYFNAISSFGTFYIDTDQQDQYGETNHFIGTASSSYGGQNTTVGVRGYISCAKLGRCCSDGVEEGINACLNIPNVDNPTTTEEELWIGDANPYFDPLWIVNPCDTIIDQEIEIPHITCTDDSLHVCCPTDTIIEGGIIIPDCEQERIDLALHNASVAYEQYLEEEKKKIKHQYMTQCLAATQTFYMTHESGQHHFVLSYYDQCGNLTRTVPPNGTYEYDDNTTLADRDKTFQTQQELNAVAQARANGQQLTPIYEDWDTRYTYNSLNQITTQNLPDHGDPGTGNNPNPRNGITQFKYDNLGRLVFSQNPEQKLDANYSYTTYDELGRIVESGQARSPHQNNVFLQSLVFNPYGGGEFYPGIFLNMCDKEQITHTYYDEAPPAPLTTTFPNNSLDNLRGRVAYAEYYDTQNDLDNRSALSGSYYSYDPLGNVKALTQRLRGAFQKNIEYEYDLVSGNVNKVIYQGEEADQFIHRYNYDADNRITQVETSTDGCIWDKEAKYFYYPHGPLARVELGNEQIQGLDYIYTIHGWIKGVNSSGLLPKYDAGTDGLAGSQNVTFAPDEMGYMLNYYSGDYEAISGSQDFTPNVGTTSPDLFNGNIRNMTTSIGHFIQENTDYGYVSNDYSYDQLNRITEMRPWDDYNPTTNLWDNNDPRDPTWDSNPYYTKYKYDGNGNIDFLQRNGAPSMVDMDKLTYSYKSKNNRLNAVTDDIPSSNYPQLPPNNPLAIHDIDSRPIFNYSYDKIGNLTRDKAEGFQISWNVQGKVRKILDTNGLPNQGGLPDPSDDRHVEMVYDPLGNRIANIIDGKATYYVRDAQGNVMATYEDTEVDQVYADDEVADTGGGSTPLPTTGGTGNARRINPNIIAQNLPIALAGQENEMIWQSAYIYGSDRVGEYAANKKVGGPQKEQSPIDIGYIPYTGVATPSPTPTLTDAEMEILTGFFDSGSSLFGLPIFNSNNSIPQSFFSFAKAKTNFKRGNRKYELNNHLGNVLATVADRKSVRQGGLALSGVEGEVLTANDYYPVGMLMPNRNYSYDASYRFKHQSQESDDDLTGNGNNYFYKYRMSDSRLNRFWSVDPLGMIFPQNTPYNFSSNRLTNSIEYQGFYEKKLTEGPFGGGWYDNDVSGIYRVTSGQRVALQTYEVLFQTFGGGYGTLHSWMKAGAEVYYNTNERALVDKVKDEGINIVSDKAIDAVSSTKKTYHDPTGWNSPQKYKTERTLKGIPVGKMMKLGLKSIGFMSGIYDLSKLSATPTKNEFLMSKTFEFMEEQGLGNVNIAQNGLFTFNSKIKNGGELIKTANLVYNLMKNTAESQGFTLTTLEDQALFEAVKLNNKGKNDMIRIINQGEDK